ncbi:MAG: TraR/DksA C4-type zinc finger protein [Parcubacteria group bacterium]|nr:TraR/DksA C4-type zinc finger protein [Parcubacteria group bacterium]
MQEELKNELKDLLIKEKGDLEENLKKIANKDKNLKGDYDAKFENMDSGVFDQSAEASEVTEYDKRLSLEANFEVKLKEVNEALTRIESGDYGKCSKCGMEISDERLKADPAASTCIKCADSDKRGTYYKG